MATSSTFLVQLLLLTVHYAMCINVQITFVQSNSCYACNTESIPDSVVAMVRWLKIKGDIKNTMPNQPALKINDNTLLDELTRSSTDSSGILVRIFDGGSSSKANVLPGAYIAKNNGLHVLHIPYCLDSSKGISISPGKINKEEAFLYHMDFDCATQKIIVASSIAAENFPTLRVLVVSKHNLKSLGSITFLTIGKIKNQINIRFQHEMPDGNVNFSYSILKTEVLLRESSGSDRGLAYFGFRPCELRNLIFIFEEGGIGMVGTKLFVEEPVPFEQILPCFGIDSDIEINQALEVRKQEIEAKPGKWIGVPPLTGIPLEIEIPGQKSKRVLILQEIRQ